MCAVSMVLDHYKDKWQDFYPIAQPDYKPNSYYDRLEIEKLRKEVEELKKLVKRARQYDEDTGQKDCELVEKKEYLKKIADILGIELKDIID